MAIEASIVSDNKPIRLGMVGGGNDAFIGGVHRIAARLDGRYTLVAGALSSSPEKALASGEALNLDSDRIYTDFEQMAKAESERADGIEVVSIVTPNHVHFDAAKAFLQRGIHVICDKPLTSTLEDAKKLATEVQQSKAQFFLTHNYTGYPMVRQAREMVHKGSVGTVRVVQVEYPQDWLTVEETNKQAQWRTDPARSGAGGSTGDIGTHAFNLSEFITGLSLESLAADLQSFVPGRLVDDNANVMLRYTGGARGVLWCSQVAPGNENSLKFRVYGEKGGLSWQQEHPNSLEFTPFGQPCQTITRAGAGMYPSVANTTRIPPGHPEGYLEGFANLYKEIADVISSAAAGQTSDHLIPTVNDGVRGVAFVDACVRSSKQNAAWVSLDTTTEKT